MARRRRRCRVLVVCIYVSWFLSACNSQAGKAGEVTRKCFSQNNTDRPGRDFYGMPIEKLTYEDCCTACLENALCKALAYNEDNRRCWFKHDAPPPSPLANHISAILEDSQEPVIICPSDFETSTYIDMHTIELTWSLPSVSDNSGSVNLSVSHERGSNFSIGVTTVSYKAEDPFGNTAYCWFKVTVKDIQKPVIICPSDIETSTYIDMHTIELTWSLPSVSDNSGTVNLFVNHESGSNFSIGVTTVSYIAEDPSGNTAYCWFSVAVKAVARPLFDDTNATRMNISTSEIIEKFDKLSDTLSQLKDLNISAEETGLLAQDILQSMNKAIEVFKNTSEHDINDQDMDLLTKSVLRTTDDLAKFVLRNIEPGSGHVLETPAIRLNVDIDYAEKLTNTSVEMGDGHTFRLPQMQNLFLNWTSRQPIGRIVKRLLRRSFRHDDNAYVYDVLSMSFTDGELNDLEVNGTEEDISITFAGDSQAPETPVVVEGVYLEFDDVTYFGMDVNITHLFHAVIINLESPDAVYGITEAYIFNDMVEYSSNYSGYQFSVDVQFDGGNSSIFIPENYILKAERYYLTFTVPQKQDVKFSMSVKHVVCDYLNEESGTWKNDGCKVSPASNMTSTVCLCNHLTTFKSNVE